MGTFKGGLEKGSCVGAMGGVVSVIDLTIIRSHLLFHVHCESVLSPCGQFVCVGSLFVLTVQL
jgi:hypothetical protein